MQIKNLLYYSSEHQLKIFLISLFKQKKKIRGFEGGKRKATGWIFEKFVVNKSASQLLNRKDLGNIFSFFVDKWIIHSR
jgi:hypothetical protein